jgi:alkylhydroperoxidase family enzyme
MTLFAACRVLFSKSMEIVSDAVYQEAVRLFDEPYLAQLIVAIVTINAWNRIAVATRLLP